jgi:hypothetical protein
MGEAIRSDAAHPKLTLLRTTSIKTHMFGRVTINGANFSVPDPADLTVMFNLTEAVVYSASATSIVAIAPLVRGNHWADYGADSLWQSH